MLLSGCSSSGGQFGKTYNSVQTGATKDQVRAAMGQPDSRFIGRVGSARNTGDPRGTLSGTFPHGTPFEVWRYTRGNTEYRMYFGAAPGLASSDWRLVNREAVPLNVAP